MNLLDLMVKIGLDDQASGKIGQISGNIKSGLASAAKAGAVAIGAAVTAAAAGTAALGKAALDSYASYEQLSGGVDKLFGDASEQLKAYAQDAYKTSGMSANQYMEQATSFSAALIQSLGGDTAKAAEQADVAMRAMSDNVNTFGSDMSSVQMAFQGFAKQNYTMLDNLKLGYGGTKSEMERLIADANEYAASIGQASDLSIDSFSDIVTAIDLIQQKQHIAGTTAREAATTIEGSIAMTKAAWANLLAEFGKDDGDVGKRVQELVESAKTALLGYTDEATGEVQGGIIPRVKQIFSAIAAELPSAIPQLLEVGKEVFMAIAEAVSIVAPQIFSAIMQVLGQMAQFISENRAQVAEGAMQAFLGIAEAVAEVVPVILEAIVGLFLEIVGQILTHIPEILTAVGTLLNNVVDGILMGFASILGEVGNFLAQIMENVNTAWEGMLAAVGEFFGQIWEAIASIGASIQADWESMWQTIGNFLSSIWNGIKSTVSGAIGAVSGAISGALATISGIWNSTWSTVSSFVSTTWESVKSAVSGGVEGMMSFISSIPDRVMGFFSDAADWLVNAGGEIIDGLINGIKGALSGLKDTLSGVTSLIPDWKGPEDVDRNLLVESGQLIMQGLINGIGSKRDALKASLGNVTEAISDWDYGTATAEVGFQQGQGMRGESELDVLIDFLRAFLPVAIRENAPSITRSEFGRTVRGAVAW